MMIVMIVMHGPVAAGALVFRTKAGLQAYVESCPDTIRSTLMAVEDGYIRRSGYRVGGCMPSAKVEPKVLYAEQRRITVALSEELERLRKAQR